MMLYFRLLNESLRFALHALRSNKLRTLLSLLGVTVGIFSIIAVLAAVDSMDRNIKSELSGFDRNMIYLFNHSFGPSEVPKWKSEQFPEVTYDEYEYLRRNVEGLDKISYNVFTRRENLMYEGNYANAVNVSPCTTDNQYLENIKIAEGRFFNESESNSGVPVLVLGHEVATSLFGAQDPIGKQVRLYGKRFTVIGVVEKQGASNFGMNKDSSAYFPVNFLRQLYGDNNKMVTPVIVLKPESGIDIEQFKDEITSKLRMKRGVKPTEENNFFVNVWGGLMDFIDNIVTQMNVVGWIVSGFSLLVGGFGIANIMFVSVKERTHLIGIQKSLGAKKRFILFQFLFEAVILSLIGGIVGMLLVSLIAFVATQFLDFKFVLSFYNIVIGMSLSAFIGLLSGLLPARSASNLDPVEAIRAGG